MEPTASVPGQALVRVGLLAVAVALVALFALTGSTLPGRVLALGVAAVLVQRFVPRFSPTLLLAGIPVLLFLPIVGGWRIFDVIAPMMLIAAVLVTARARDRRAYELHGPGLIAVLVLLAPLPGAMFVASLTSFLGSLKDLLAYCIMFLSVRRLVSKSQSVILLWTFPPLGVLATLQLLSKTSGVGGALLARSSFRNFYTNLEWGASNAIAALLLVCLCGTALLAMIDHRKWVRIGLLAAAGIMIQAFLLLSSRSATIALGVFVLVLVLGLGGRFRLVALAGGVAVAVAGLSLSSARLLRMRFSDPTEYASWTERQRMWASAWQRFVDHPWIGIGLNQGRYYGDYLGDSHAHNWFLDTLMEQGILGGIAILIALIAIFRMCARIEPTGEPVSDHRIRVVCVAFVCAVVMQSLVEPTLLAYLVTLPFVWFLAWVTKQDPAGFDPLPIRRSPG